MTFAELWLKHPRKVAKKSAERAYNRIVKTISAKTIADSHEFMLRTQWRGRPVDYVPHLASWLNRECFEERTELLEDEFPLFAGPESVPEPQLQECDYCLVMIPAGEIQIIHGLKACRRDARLWDEAKL